ncbi:hypothetical protein PR048_016289 [Dryococelus australis]|uniref:Uncharacterized protein n=1 Tax=Dryococelus australis TaxID=614101 RepID=A0ABQ9HJB9_9NEOP|nr:hypothetical protein PR048_016289 [Dryococelus australis]
MATPGAVHPIIVCFWLGLPIALGIAVTPSMSHQKPVSSDQATPITYPAILAQQPLRSHHWILLQPAAPTHTPVNRVRFLVGSPHMFACGNRAGQCRWSVVFLGISSFPPLLHSGAAPYPSHFILICSQDLDIEGSKGKVRRSSTGTERLRLQEEGESMQGEDVHY